MNKSENQKENKKEEIMPMNNTTLDVAEALCILALPNANAQVTSNETNISRYTNIPNPKNGVQHTPIEVWKIFNENNVPNGSNAFIKHLKNNANLIPIQIRQTCKITKMKIENAPNTWNQKGRKRMLTAEETCNPAFKRLKENKGLGVDNEMQIKDLIKV